ncbi:rRNA maturation RNase YbeY [Paracoccus pacificus]|uniref:Endoribonuclease YbeY n=1 Tax=Paracoccus pacificus TaxID=1463598 RepID=A0ABW4R4Z4_9RHOB
MSDRSEEYFEHDEHAAGPIDCVIEDDRWLDINLPLLADMAARATLDWLSLDPNKVEIVCLACDDARIATLNASFRGKPTPTNVLSWPAVAAVPRQPGETPRLSDPMGFEGALGDIAIAWETCAAEAVAQGKPMPSHVIHLLIHSILHLAGYDHIDEMDAENMESVERQILAGLEIPDPYADEKVVS